MPWLLAPSKKKLLHRHRWLHQKPLLLLKLLRLLTLLLRPLLRLLTLLLLLLSRHRLLLSRHRLLLKLLRLLLLQPSNQHCLKKNRPAGRFFFARHFAARAATT